MKAIEFIGIVESGRITPPAGLRPFMKEHENKQVRIILSQNVKRRSLSQNSFYWSVVVPTVCQLRMDNGDTVSTEQAHEDLIAEFSTSVPGKTLKGFRTWHKKRTSEMSKEEMVNFCEAIIARLAEFGCFIKLEGDML